MYTYTRYNTLTIRCFRGDDISTDDILKSIVVKRQQSFVPTPYTTTTTQCRSIPSCFAQLKSRITNWHVSRCITLNGTTQTKTISSTIVWILTCRGAVKEWGVCHLKVPTCRNSTSSSCLKTSVLGKRESEREFKETCVNTCTCMGMHNITNNHRNQDK